MRIHVYTLRLRERGGGAHQNLMVFARALIRAGHTVTVHALFSDGNDSPSDIPLQRERGDRRSFLLLQNFCADILGRDEPSADVMLVYGQALLWAGGQYRGRGGRVPVAVYLDSHLDSMKEAHRGRHLVYRIKHMLWERTIGRWYASAVDRYIAASPYLVERFSRAGFPKHKFVVIPNAFDFSDLSEKKEVDAEVPTLLYVGRLSHEKGVDVLVDVLTRLSRDTKWRAVLAGDGPQREELAHKVDAFGLSDRVRIAGWQDRAALAEEYANADVLVVPSRVPEPFGRTIVEAMHVGLPVIIPKRGGAAWVAGDAGVTFENGDAASLAHVISELVANDARRKSLGERGRIRAHDFDVSVVVPALARELSNLVGKAAA